MENEKKNLTAAQRLEGLEASFALLDQSVGNLTMNLQTSINALTLISKKLEAIVRLGNAGQQITSKSVANEIIQMNVEDLQERVEDLKAKGVTEPAEVVAENSFVIGRELLPESKEVSTPRIQFPMFGLKPERKAKLLGKKIGDIIQLEEGRNLLEITELYNIVVPRAAAPQPAPQPEAQPEATTPEPAPAAPETPSQEGSNG